MFSYKYDFSTVMGYHNRKPQLLNKKINMSACESKTSFPIVYKKMNVIM